MRPGLKGVRDNVVLDVLNTAAELSAFVTMPYFIMFISEQCLCQVFQSFCRWHLVARTQFIQILIFLHAVS